MGRKRKAGHRNWAPMNARILGGHRGDIMSPEKRSRLMSRIRGKDTNPENVVAAGLQRLSLKAERHASDLPGQPDFVFRASRIAIFVDGDFWHGWRFPLWAEKLSDWWREKIKATRARDQRNFARLRRSGWVVVRIWEHQVESDAGRCIRRIVQVLRNRKSRTKCHDLASV
jgi:DNA mismatch endonuclease (patch repair protein)